MTALITPNLTLRLASDPVSHRGLMSVCTHVYTCLFWRTRLRFCAVSGRFLWQVIDAHRPATASSFLPDWTVKRGNPSEVTAHVHHGSLCALIVLFRVKLCLLSSVSFLDNKPLGGKTRHDSCCHRSVWFYVPLSLWSNWIQGEVRMTHTCAGKKFTFLF